MQVPFGIALADAQHGADLAMGEALDDKQIEHRTRCFGQTVQVPEQIVVVDVQIGSAGAGQFGSRLHRVVKTQAAPRTHKIDGCIDHDPFHPGKQVPFCAELVEMRKNVEKRLVQDIGGIVAGACVAQANPHDRGVIVPVKLLLRSSILPSAAFENMC